MIKKDFLEHFWFEFDLKNYSNEFYIPSQLGYGVTAYNIEDAKEILIKEIFNDKDLPNLINLKESIKFSEIETNHVTPNIGLYIERGIWFPNLNM